MSRVFIAEDAALKRRVVVKVLPAEMVGEVSIARFQREIAVAARLQHPHIVPLLSTGETQGVPFYTMPFVDGETLRDRLARVGELPVVEAVRLLREIATALGYAHEQGVVHRDIKPENVLLSGGVALVTDFGVAKALGDASTSDRGPLTATGVSVGTPAYMSPEQVSADPNVDHRADIYAFGMLAYEMLAGQSPFAGRTAQQLLAAHVIDAPEPLQTRRPSVPPALAALVMRCLEKRPADRPQQASEIVHALDAVATPAQTMARARGSSRRSRVVLAAAALIVVAAGARRGSASVGMRTAATVVVAAAHRAVRESHRRRALRSHRANCRRPNLAAGRAGRLDRRRSVEHRIDGAARHDGGEAQRLKRLSDATHAGLLLSGTIVLRGDSLVLQGQVTDARTDKVAFPLVPATSLASDPIAAVDALGDRLLGALGGGPDIIVATRRGWRAPTYAAYQEFSAGWERFAVQGDVIGSRPFFERAIALDSTYTRAYQLLGRQYIEAREFERADSMARRIEHLPQGLSTVERLQLDYMKADLAGDIPGLLRSQQQLVARDSNPLSARLVGEAAMFMLRPDIAVPAFEFSEPAMSLLGGIAARGHTADFSESLHEAGMHDRELRLITDKRSLFPEIGCVRGRQLRAYAGLAQPTPALALADTMARAANDSSGRVLLYLETGAAEFRAHGDTRHRLAVARDGSPLDVDESSAGAVGGTPILRGCHAALERNGG